MKIDVCENMGQVLGSRCPDKVVFRIDLETGPGFAGAGEHSAGCNDLADMLANYRCSATSLRAETGPARGRLGVDGYANKWDKLSSWKSPLSWLTKWAIAGYSSTAPSGVSWYSWQYYGGDPRWSSPAGFPRSCAPFGSHIDMNAIRRPIAQILIDYGVTAPKPAGVDMASEFKTDAERDAYVRRIAAQVARPIAEQTTADGLYATLSGNYKGRFARWSKAKHPLLYAAGVKVRAGLNRVTPPAPGKKS